MKKNIDRTLVVKNILANIRVLAIVVACLTVLGVGNAWGANDTVNISISSYATSKSWSTNTSYRTVTSGSVTLTANDNGGKNTGSNTGKYVSTNSSWRLYESESSYLTIDAGSGNELVSFKLTFSIDNKGTFAYGGSAIASGTAKNVPSGNQTTSTGTVGHSSGSSNGQIQITAIQVVYTATCDKSVTVSSGSSSTNGSISTISGSPVATCDASASNRTVTITVSPNTGYVAPANLSFSVTSGSAVTATKQSGPTNNVYVYSFAQNDNNSTCKVNVACVGKQCTLIFNQNGGTGGQTSNLTATYGSAMPAISGVPTREHYDFEGYYDGVGGTGNKYYNSDGTSATNWNKNTTANTTLYAKWTEHSLKNYRTTCSSTYDIVLDKNGGDANGSAKVDANATKLKSISAPTKTGYKVEGYYAESGKTNLVAAVDGTLEEDVEISSTDWTDEDGKWVKGSGATLYAGWTPISYEVRFNKNNASATGTMSNESYDYDESKDLTNNAFELTGYTFAGWAETSDGDVEHEDGAEVENLSETDGDVVDLYAVWAANKYTVTLANTNATSGSSQTVSATYDAAMPLKTTADGTPAVAALSRTGYTFNGWSYESTQYYSYDGSSISSAHNWDIADNKTLSPDWTVNSYTLTWSWGGGSTSSTTHTAAGSVAYGTTLVYPDNATMSKTGYTFTGWSSTPSTMPASNTTITAQWSINNYNLAVVTNSNVTITATPDGGSAIDEGDDADVNYNKTVTLNYSSLGSGLTWGGWKVYKADDETPVAVSGTGDGATFTLPAYDVKVEAIVYSVGIAWCDPDVEVTGDVHLTSTKDVYVHSTSGAGNLISISSSDMGSATKMEVGYLDENEDEVDKAESPFRLYNSTASSTIDEEDLEYGWDVNYSLRYTPTDYSQLHNYKLQLTFKRGDKVLKTVTHDINGRSLPEEFVIAVKNTNDSKWYALPSNLARTAELQSALALNPSLEIELDQTGTPTKATIAPSTRIYKATGRNNAAQNITGIRFTNDGSHWLQSGNTNTKLWLSGTNSDASQVFYLKSTDFGAYELAFDPSQGSNRKIGVYLTSGTETLGHPATGSAHSTIYLLPVETKIDELAATADDWTQHDVLVEANASSVSATKVLGVLGATTSGKETVPTPVAENTYLLKLDGDLDYVDKDGQTLQLKWYDSSDELKAYSWVTVPSIITAGTKTTWKALEDSLTTSTTLNDIVVLSKPMTVGEEHAKAKKIVMDQSGDNTGKLTVQPSKGLEVASTVKVYNGTNFVATGEADLVLESSSSDGNASLIFDNSNSCKATVQMYSKAAIDGETWNWQYVGTPFAGSIPLYNYYGSWMYKWNNGWDVVHGGDVLDPFAGYCLTQESATTHVMGGTLVATDGNDQEIEMGEETDMVLANSWTAPIWIGGFTTEGEGATFTSEPATIYMFNTGSAENGSSAGTAESGTYEAIPINSAPFTGDGLIPSMQGFFVTTNGVGGAEGKIKLKYDELVRPENDRQSMEDPNIITTGPMYAPKRVDKPEVMKIMANGSKYSDRVVLLERADFSSGFDNGWDGEKLIFGVEGPSVYVINGQGKYDAVSAIPSFEGTVVGFRSGTDNSCTISFEYDGNETLYLNDLKMQQSTPIDTVHTYTFSTASSDNEARFIISATPITAVTTGFESSAVSGQSSEVRKVLIGSQIYIIRGGRMYSAEGQMVN